jgi:hypothetical protein
VVRKQDERQIREPPKAQFKLIRARSIPLFKRIQILFQTITQLRNRPIKALFAVIPAGIAGIQKPGIALRSRPVVGYPHPCEYDGLHG